MNTIMEDKTIKNLAKNNNEDMLRNQFFQKYLVKKQLNVIRKVRLHIKSYLKIKNSMMQ